MQHARRYIIDLQVFRNVTNFDHLTVEEQGQLVECMFRDDDKDLCSIYENRDRERIETALSEMLKSDIGINHLRLAETIRTCMINYYRDRAQELIEDVTAENEAHNMYSAGYTRTQDCQTGERIWRRA